jgi:hypothetical protein
MIIHETPYCQMTAIDVLNIDAIIVAVYALVFVAMHIYGKIK